MSSTDKVTPINGVLGAVVGAIAAQAAAIAITIVTMVFAMLPEVFRGRPPVTPTFSLLMLAPGLAATQLVLLAFAAGLPALARVPIRSALGLRAAHPFVYAIGFVGMLGGQQVGGYLAAELRRHFPFVDLQMLEQLGKALAEAPIVFGLLLVAVLPAVCEELFFRGFLQRALGRGAVPVLVSGLSFAIYHLDPAQAAGVLPLGLFLAFLADRVDSTIPGIVLHAINNAMAIVLTKVDLGAVGEEIDTPRWPLALTGLAVMLGASALLALYVARGPGGRNAPPPQGF